MFTLRPTQKLQRRLRALPADSSSATASTTHLGGWYANLLVHHRRQVVLFVSERTLLPIVVPVAPDATLVPRFRDALAELLLAIGVADADVRAELREMDAFTVAKTSNRRVLGSMNDFAWLLEASPPEETLLNAARLLADAPCSPIGMESPQAMTVALFASNGDIGLAK